MIFDKIVEKVISKKVDELKGQLIQYVSEHKDDVIERVKECALNYINEHIEEVLNIIKNKIAEKFSQK